MDIAIYPAALVSTALLSTFNLSKACKIGSLGTIVILTSNYFRDKNESEMMQSARLTLSFAGAFFILYMIEKPL